MKEDWVTTLLVPEILRKFDRVRAVGIHSPGLKGMETDTLQFPLYVTFLHFHCLTLIVLLPSVCLFAHICS